MELFWKKKDIVKDMFMFNKNFFPPKKLCISSNAPNKF